MSKKYKVFGVGLGKTGTTTLRTSLDILGYNVSENVHLLREYHKGNLDYIFRFSDEHDAFQDFPWPFLYKEMDNKYENAKFILTKRKNSREWFGSLKKHADITGPTEAKKLAYGYVMPYGLREEHVEFYERHNEQVKKYFEGRENLLEVQWEEGDGWEEICEFLGHSVPKEPFPHSNASPKGWKAHFRRYWNRAKWITQVKMNRLAGRRPWDNSPTLG
jgi:hypothetical protein